MPFLFTSLMGRRNPSKTLTVDAYVARMDQEILTPGTKALGFKTFVEIEPSSPFLIDEEIYIEQFRAHWLTAVAEVAESFGVTIAEALDLFNSVDSTMTTRPTIQVSGPPSRPEEAPEPVAPSGTISRVDRKNAVLRKLRPPPLKHEWALWHDRHISDANSPADKAKEPDYEAGLKKMIEINTVQTFWETYNNFPFENLILRDSLYLFKRTVKPVWEDPRNVHGGSWTLRVSKANSAEVWKYAQLMAIGEVLQEVVEPGDDICGVGLSVRFNSHLISVWNRDASNQKSVDAIIATVLDQLPDELKPTPQNYYYKKHSEHKGFNTATSA